MQLVHEPTFWKISWKISQTKPDVKRVKVYFKQENGLKSWLQYRWLTTDVVLYSGSLILSIILDSPCSFRLSKCFRFVLELCGNYRYLTIVKKFQVLILSLGILMEHCAYCLRRYSGYWVAS